VGKLAPENLNQSGF